MKIVDIAEFYAPQGGGVKTYIDQKLSAAARCGHDMTIIAPGPKTSLQRRPHGRIWWVKAAQLPFDNRYYVFTRSAEVHALLDDIQPDILEASSTWRGAWIAAQWQGAALKSLVLHQDPVSVYPHSLLDRFVPPRRIDTLFGWFWHYLRRLSVHFDTRIVSGDWLAARFEGVGMERPAVVPFGINKQGFSPSHRDAALRADFLKALGLDPARAKLLINVSRHHPEKRLKTVFKAISIANRHQPVGLLQIGAGPFTKALQKVAARDRAIRLHGFTHDRAHLATLLASADAMIHGGAAETYGLVLAEGLCSGLPLIAPNKGGAFDLAGHSYAEIYQTGSAASAAQAIQRLFSREVDALNAAVKCAAEERIWSHSAHFAALFSHYADLTGRRRHVA